MYNDDNSNYNNERKTWGKLNSKSRRLDTRTWIQTRGQIIKIIPSLFRHLALGLGMMVFMDRGDRTASACGLPCSKCPRAIHQAVWRWHSMSGLTNHFVASSYERICRPFLSCTRSVRTDRPHEETMSETPWSGYKPCSSSLLIV